MRFKYIIFVLMISVSNISIAENNPCPKTETIRHYGVFTTSELVNNRLWKFTTDSFNDQNKTWNIIFDTTLIKPNNSPKEALIKGQYDFDHVYLNEEPTYHAKYQECVYTMPNAYLLVVAKMLA